MKTGFALIFVGITTMYGVVGCGSEQKDYCDKKVSCEGGNDKDKAACASEAEAAEDSAEDYGCGDQFGKLLDCVNSNSSCQGSSTKTYTTYDLTTGVNKCQSQVTALDACVRAASGRNSPYVH